MLDEEPLMHNGMVPRCCFTHPPNDTIAIKDENVHLIEKRRWICELADAGHVQNRAVLSQKWRYREGSLKRRSTFNSPICGRGCNGPNKGVTGS